MLIVIMINIYGEFKPPVDQDPFYIDWELGKFSRKK